MTLFDCIELMSIYPAFHDCLIEASLHSLYLSKLDGVLNESLENVQSVTMLLQCPIRLNAWNERKAMGEGK